MNQRPDIHGDVRPQSTTSPVVRRQTLSREVRILGLAFLFFLSGCAFFLLHSRSGEPVPAQSVAVSVEEDRSDTRSALAHYPAPDTFEQFTFEPGMRAYTVSGTCTDRYYAVLIYPTSIDYRESALDAKYNMASDCIGGVFETLIGIHSLPLTEGTSYYVVRAQQGTQGGWYNPY